MIDLKMREAIRRLLPLVREVTSIALEEGGNFRDYCLLSDTSSNRVLSGGGVSGDVGFRVRHI